MTGLRILSVLAGLLGGSCGGGSEGAGRAAQTGLPQVVTLGGPVLVHPKVQPIIYTSDPGASDILAFLQQLATTSYWSETTSEYGVGSLAVLPAIMLDTSPPTIVADATLQSNLSANTTGASPTWGAADPNTIYLLILPPGTIEQDTQGACCAGFDGYHYETSVGSGQSAVAIPYAVSCACPGFDGANVTDLQERTIDMSHELVETATDPFPISSPAFTQEDQADLVWTLVTGGEVGDMCAFNDDAYVVPAGLAYTVQRSWSNVAAARFDNPCVPVTTTSPYFNSFPQLGTISYNSGMGAFSTQGVRIQLDQSKTIDVVLRSSTALAKSWSVAAYDYDQAIAGTTPGALLRQDQSIGVDGDTIRLTITPTNPDPTLGGEAFIIWSDHGNPGDPDFESQLSMGLITN